MYWYQQGHIQRSKQVSQIKISRNHRQVLPYIKLPVLLELKMRENFFSIKMRAFTEAKSYQNS